MTEEIKIDVNVSPPPEFFPPPKKRVAKPKKADDAMLTTLRDIGLIAKKSGDLQKTHVRIMRSFVVAQVDAITLGLPFGYNFDTLLNFQQLLDAKRRSGEEFAATMLDDGSVSVVAGDLSMRVGAANPMLWHMDQPDAKVAPANDSLRDALFAAHTFSTDKLDRPEIAGLQLNANTVVGTNGFGFIEAWHGWDMPHNQRIPMMFAKVLAKIKRPIVGFGFSDISFTVWFQDGGFIRTAKHQPDYDSRVGELFKSEPNSERVVLPESFFKALDAIRPFCQNDVVFFVNGNISSRRNGDDSSNYRLAELPFMGFDIKLLKAVKPYAAHVKFETAASKMYFYSDKVRGIVSGVRTSKEVTLASVNGYTYTDPETGIVHSDWDDFDDDVPF